MATTAPSVIVDAILADLVTVGLGQKSTRKYVEPEVLDTAADLPLLAVWLGETRFTAMSTGADGFPVAYVRLHPVTVGWYVFDSSVNRHGFEDPTMYATLEATKESIVTRAASWSTGVPTLTDVFAALVAAHIEPLEPAGVWRATVSLEVENDG